MKNSKISSEILNKIQNSPKISPKNSKNLHFLEISNIFKFQRLFQNATCLTCNFVVLAYFKITFSHKKRKNFKFFTHILKP